MNDSSGGRVSIRPTEDGSFDELVATRSAVHIEMLADDMMWISVTPEGAERRVVLSIIARRRRLEVKTETE